MRASMRGLNVGNALTGTLGISRDRVWTMGVQVEDLLDVN